jgi:cellulose synthase (UDP-forming)
MFPILSRLPLSASRNNSVHDTPGRHRIRLLVSIGYVIAAITYFSWRVTVLNHDAITFSVLFLLGELFGTVVCFVLAFTGWRRVVLRAGSPEDGLAVDVFITVYNEPIDVIRRTALGAIAMDYAHETWILDDGDRHEIKSLARELGCRYLARTTNKGAKAGNLNNGLQHASGAFVAVFDADHVPQRDFLMKVLGYFRDPLVAVVQTPQDYFNLNAFQYGRNKYSKLIWHDQSVFHYVGQTGRNHWNAATFCGTSAILRRSAVDAIGGIPEETVTEDMHASASHRLDCATICASGSGGARATCRCIDWRDCRFRPDSPGRSV